MAASAALRTVAPQRGFAECPPVAARSSLGVQSAGTAAPGAFGAGVAARPRFKARRTPCASSGGMAASAMTTAFEPAAKVKEARREELQKERNSREFRLEELEVVAPCDWHAATVTKVEDVASGVRCVTLLAECSREFVTLDKAYKKPGQLVGVKVGGETIAVAPSSPPFPDEVNWQVLYKCRGDIPAGTTKLAAFSISVKAPLNLHVTEAESPALYSVAEGSEVELGPFQPTGLDLRPILFLARYPSILIFAHGKGIAVGRALLEAKDADVGTLNLGLREDVRLYYSAPRPSLLAYQNLFPKWEERKSVKVRAVVDSADGEDWNGYEGSLATLWDEDDIEYDPVTTGAVVAVESSKRAEVKSLLAEAGIPESQIVYWDV